MAKFLIDGDQDTPQPHNLIYNRRSEGARHQGGGVTVHGTPFLDVVWTILTEDEIEKLFDLYYAATAGLVTLTYDGYTGESLTGSFAIGQPVPGNRAGAYFSDTRISFRAIDDQGG